MPFDAIPGLYAKWMTAGQTLLASMAPQELVKDFPREAEAQDAGEATSTSSDAERAPA